jgi:protein-L-isoaspartate(D-aspartate) O-methyltransferase
VTDRRRERELMVELQLAGRGVADARVLQAMAAVERERFVPVDHADDAYADLDLPIGYGQVLHRPVTLARALELLQPTGGERLLVVGAGAGYPVAVVAQLAREVVATERVPQLAARAARNLAGIARVLAVDGTQGVASEPPFDAGLVLAAGARSPARVAHELAPGGRLVHVAADGSVALVSAGRDGGAG